MGGAAAAEPTKVEMAQFSGVINKPFMSIWKVWPFRWQIILIRINLNKKHDILRVFISKCTTFW